MAAKHSLPKNRLAVDGKPVVLPNETDSILNSKQLVESVSTQVITRRADFVAANRGKRFVTPGFVLLIHKRRDGHKAGDKMIRHGITVTKKIGNAVVRNRMKRRFRALIRATLSQHGIAGADHILIGRKQKIEPEYASMKADLEKGLRHLAKKF